MLNACTRYLPLALVFLFFNSGICLATVESTLSAMQNKLINVILPVVAILGLVFAALSFVAGHQNARQHLILAIIGAAVGFGAPQIMAFVRGLVN